MFGLILRIQRTNLLQLPERTPGQYVKAAARPEALCAEQNSGRVRLSCGHVLHVPLRPRFSFGIAAFVLMAAQSIAVSV
jgi:hypothetical protein